MIKHDQGTIKNKKEGKQREETQGRVATCESWSAHYRVFMSQLRNSCPHHRPDMCHHLKKEGREAGTPASLLLCSKKGFGTIKA